jgi:hypothetical protein
MIFLNDDSVSEPTKEASVTVSDPAHEVSGSRVLFPAALRCKYVSVMKFLIPYCSAAG